MQIMPDWLVLLLTRIVLGHALVHSAKSLIPSNGVYPQTMVLLELGMRVLFHV